MQPSREVVRASPPAGPVDKGVIERRESHRAASPFSDGRRPDAKLAPLPPPRRRESASHGPQRVTSASRQQRTPVAEDGPPGEQPPGDPNKDASARCRPKGAAAADGDADACVDADPAKFGVPERPGRLREVFDVGEELGRGGYATVFAARRRADGERFAVKRVDFFQLPPRKRLRCLREVQLMKPLRHPHVIQMVEAFVDGGFLILVLEWAPGGDLKSHVRRRAKAGRLMDEVAVWANFLQVAEGVRYLHSRRVVHRDVKPANVLVGAGGELKVADLGLGVELEGSGGEAYSKVGTPYYVSPEVLRGTGHSYASDVWSLGCLLYELAALRGPFERKGSSLPEVFKRVTAGEYPQLPEGRFTAALEGVVADALTVDPSQRVTLDALTARAQAALEGLLKAGHDAIGAAQRGCDAARVVWLRMRSEGRGASAGRSRSASPLADSALTVAYGSGSGSGSGGAKCGSGESPGVEAQRWAAAGAEVPLPWSALTAGAVGTLSPWLIAAPPGTSRGDWPAAREQLGCLAELACVLGLAAARGGAGWARAVGAAGAARAMLEAGTPRAGGCAVPLAPEESDTEARVSLAHHLRDLASAAGVDVSLITTWGVAQGWGREACALLGALGDAAMSSSHQGALFRRPISRVASGRNNNHTSPCPAPTPVPVGWAPTPDERLSEDRRPLSEIWVDDRQEREALVIEQSEEGDGVGAGLQADGCNVGVASKQGGRGVHGDGACERMSSTGGHPEPPVGRSSDPRGMDVQADCAPWPVQSTQLLSAALAELRGAALVVAPALRRLSRGVAKDVEGVASRERRVAEAVAGLVKELGRERAREGAARERLRVAEEGVARAKAGLAAVDAELRDISERVAAVTATGAEGTAELRAAVRRLGAELQGMRVREGLLVGEIDRRERARAATLRSDRR